jgi:hypothetical protein
VVCKTGRQGHWFRIIIRYGKNYGGPISDGTPLERHMAAKTEGPLPGVEKQGFDVPYEAQRAAAERELEQTLAGPKSKPVKMFKPGGRKL